MQEIVADLRAEQESLDAFLVTLAAPQWDLPTPAEGWSLRDSVAHIAHIDEVAVELLHGNQSILEDAARIGAAVLNRGLQRGRALSPNQILSWWREIRTVMLAELSKCDPRKRISWFAMPMGARAFATARLMETWAHGLDCYDAAGVQPEDTDRLRHVAFLAYAARPFAYLVNRLPVPERPLRLELLLPSGTLWVQGPEQASDRIRGRAGEFCRVAVRRRHWLDMTLAIEGDEAKRFMQIVQAYAGPPGPGRKPLKNRVSVWKGLREDFMDYPWTKYFSLGIVVPAFFRDIRLRKGPVLEVMHRAVKDPFFQALEFSGAEDPVVRKEIAKMVRAGGKSLVFSGGSYCYVNQNNLHDLDEGRRRTAVENVRKIIDEACEYGCEVLYVMGFEAPADRQAGLQKFRDSFSELSDYARGKNPAKPLTLSVENFHIFLKDPFLIGPTLAVADLIRDLRRDHFNIGLTFDTSHILQLGEDLPSTYRSVQDVIAHVHLSNCLLSDRSSPFYGDKHPPYGMPGSEIGAFELAAFLRVLKDAGHFERTFPTGKPVLSMEVITPPNQTPEKTLAEAKESFLSAWKGFAGS